MKSDEFVVKVKKEERKKSKDLIFLPGNVFFCPFVESNSHQEVYMGVMGVITEEEKKKHTNSMNLVEVFSVSLRGLGGMYASIKKVYTFPGELIKNVPYHLAFILKSTFSDPGLLRFSMFCIRKKGINTEKTDKSRFVAVLQRKIEIKAKKTKEDFAFISYAFDFQVRDANEVDSYQVRVTCKEGIEVFRSEWFRVLSQPSFVCNI